MPPMGLEGLICLANVHSQTNLQMNLRFAAFQHLSISDPLNPSIDSDDDDFMIGWPCLWVQRRLLNPIRACNTLPHSGHGYVGPAEVLRMVAEYVKPRFPSIRLFLSL